MVFRLRVQANMVGLSFHALLTGCQVAMVLKDSGSGAPVWTARRMSDVSVLDLEMVWVTGFVCWLLNVPTTCECGVSVLDLEIVWVPGFVCWLFVLRPSNMRVYLRDRSAQTILRAATLRQKLQIKLSISPSHSILTPSQPVPALTL